MKCSSCNKQKANLHARRSNLIKGMNLFMCQACIDLKYEPRYVIILHGRSEGPDKVVDYIKNHRYFGEPILAKELIT